MNMLYLRYYQLTLTFQRKAIAIPTAAIEVDDFFFAFHIMTALIKKREPVKTLCLWSELAPAVTTDIAAIVSGDYVIGVAFWTIIPHAALHS